MNEPSNKQTNDRINEVNEMMRELSVANISIIWLPRAHYRTADDDPHARLLLLSLSCHYLLYFFVLLMTNGFFHAKHHPCAIYYYSISSPNEMITPKTFSATF